MLGGKSWSGKSHTWSSIGTIWLSHYKINLIGKELGNECSGRGRGKRKKEGGRCDDVLFKEQKVISQGQEAVCFCVSSRKHQDHVRNSPHTPWLSSVPPWLWMKTFTCEWNSLANKFANSKNWLLRNSPTVAHIGHVLEEIRMWERRWQINRDPKNPWELVRTRMRLGLRRVFR